VGSADFKERRRRMIVIYFTYLDEMILKGFSNVDVIKSGHREWKSKRTKI
jgi:hypothetical protein